MGLDRGQLQVLHELLCCLAAAFDLKGNDAASAVGQILLCRLVVFISGQSGIADRGHLRVLRQECGHRGAVLHVPRHAHMQRFKAQVEQEGVLRRLDGTEVAHQLGRGLGDEGALFPELLRVGDAVVGFVRRAKAREQVRMGHPVKLPAVYDGSADGSAVPVHVFCRGMGHDVRAPFDWPAVDRRREGVVHDQRYAVTVGRCGKLFNIQHRQRRVGDGLAEHRPRLGAEGSLQFLLGAVRGDKGRADPHLRHGHRDQVEGPTIDRGGRNDVAAALADIEQCEEISGLA